MKVVESIKHYKEYFLKVRDQNEPIDHIWPYHIGTSLMPALYLWFNVEQWAKASTMAKVTNAVIIFALFGMWILVIWRICVDFRTLPIHRIAEGISISAGGCMTFITSCRFAMQRDELTYVLTTLDQKLRATPNNTPRYEQVKSYYVLEGYILAYSVVFGAFIGLPQIIYMIWSGNLYYDIVSPISDEPYTWQWWLIVAYQGWNPVYAGIYYSLKEMLMMGLYVNFALLFRVQADTMVTVCEEENFDPDTELQKVKGVLREMVELIDLFGRSNAFTSVYFAFMCIGSYTMLSISGICMLLQSQTVGWIKAIAQSIVFPAYVGIIMSMWGFVGEMLTESVNDVEEAMYNCNWTIATRDIKRLLLMFKLRLTVPFLISAGPFFNINYENISELFKTAYYLLTILSDLLLE